MGLQPMKITMPYEPYEEFGGIKDTCTGAMLPFVFDSFSDANEFDESYIGDMRLLTISQLHEEYTSWKALREEELTGALS